MSLVAPWSSWGQDAFQQDVLPFLTTYCVECHNTKKSEGALDLTGISQPALSASTSANGENVLVFMKKGEMPPEKAKQPTNDERTALLKTLEKLMANEAKRLSGDPGVVLPRRLTGAEYNYTVRDLTGVDIRPADSFSDRSGVGRRLQKHGRSARDVSQLVQEVLRRSATCAEHVVLTPHGMKFAPFSVVTLADQTKYHEQALIQFYEEHDIRYEAYLAAAWSFRHRPQSQQNMSIEHWAEQNQLSAKYLKQLWETLNDPADDKFYLGAIRRQWNVLPRQAIRTSQRLPPRSLHLLARFAS